MHDHALALVSQEERFYSELSDVSELLLELGPLFDRLQADPVVREHLATVEREAEDILLEHRATDAANVERLKAIKAQFPPELLKEDPTEGSFRQRYGAQRFDSAAADSDDAIAEVTGPDNREDPGRAKPLAFHLRVMLRIDQSNPEPHKLELERRIHEVEEDQAHAFRAFSVRRRTAAGFSLARIRYLLNQLNPRPEHTGGWEEYLADRHHVVIAKPEKLRDIVHGTWRLGDETERREAEEVDRAIRKEVLRVCRDLRRRIGATRSRVALVNAYALRCSWYDAKAMQELAKSLERSSQKEDPLSDHLARFLFDNGLRPLTRAMVGRLVPDVFDPSPTSPAADPRDLPEVTEPAFYIEAKQYVDDSGALKAIRDGARQIWSSADRIRKRYALNEAFLVVFRRGGPLLRFPDGPVRSDSLAVRCVLVDVAGGEVSGSRQGAIIHVKPEQILAELKAPAPGKQAKKVTRKKKRARGSRS